MAQPVRLYVYDLSRGMARALSPALMGTQIDGVWHTSIVVHGKEYFYGGGMGGVSNIGANNGLGCIGNAFSSGIKYCTPGSTILGQPQEILQMGTTEVPEALLEEFLSQLSESTYRADAYNLFDHNCNNFSNEVSEFLTGHGIPDHIVSLPHAVLDTPFGNVIRSMLSGLNEMRPSNQ